MNDNNNIPCKSLVRLRTVDEAYNDIKRMDPNTKVTKYFLKTLVKTGTVPSLKVGNRKRLIDLDLLIRYLSNPSLIEKSGDEN